MKFKPVVFVLQDRLSKLFVFPIIGVKSFKSFGPDYPRELSVWHFLVAPVLHV